MCYSVQPRDRIFVKGYGYLSFAGNMGKNIGKNTSKSLIGTMLNFLTMLKNLQQMTLKLLQKEQFTTADLIGVKVAVKITKVSKNSQHNNSETVKNEDDKEIP